MPPCLVEYIYIKFIFLFFYLHTKKHVLLDIFLCTSISESYYLLFVFKPYILGMCNLYMGKKTLSGVSLQILHIISAFFDTYLRICTFAELWRELQGRAATVLSFFHV